MKRKAERNNMLQFEELMLTLRNMKPDMDDLREALGYDKLAAEVAELERKAASPDFWDACPAPQTKAKSRQIIVFIFVKTRAEIFFL